MSNPKQLAVVVGSDKHSYAVKSIDIPKYEAHEVLVKVHSAAQNPTDCGYYFQAFWHSLIVVI
jgi:NADPH:quinone reductase-like Zn-dependent oxidoreductase